MLSSYRYWINNHEYRFTHRSEGHGLIYYYHFRPVAGARRKADVVLSGRQIEKRHIWYEDQKDQKNQSKTMAHGTKLSVIRRQRNDGIIVYTASLHWVFVAQFFMFEDASLPPEERANRALIPSHAKKIEKHILDVPNFYLPPMIVSANFDGQPKFVAFEPDFPNGLLEVPFNCIWQIIDGQHRTWAMQQIFKGKQADKFKNELITVDIICNASLPLRQRIFYETNSLGKSVSRNLTTVYKDSPNAVFANAVLQAIPLFTNEFVEKEKASLSATSEKLLLYKHLYDATLVMKPGCGDEVDFQFCQQFWETLIEVIPPWQQVLSREASARWVRTNTVAAHGVTIHALGELGKFIAQTYQLSGQIKSPAPLLQKLADVQWNKNSSQWLNRVVDLNGGMLANRRNVKLMLIYFKLKIGTPIKSFSKDEQELETFHIGKEIGG